MEKFITWNLVLNNLTEKSTLGYARTLSETSYLNTPAISPTVLRFSIHIPTVGVSKEPQT